MGNKTSSIVPIIDKEHLKEKIFNDLKNLDYDNQIIEFSNNMLNKFNNEISSQEKIDTIKFIEDIKNYLHEYLKIKHCFENNILVFDFENKNELFKEKLLKRMCEYEKTYYFDNKSRNIINDIVRELQSIYIYFNKIQFIENK
jgi:hypothetical protein